MERSAKYYLGFALISAWSHILYTDSVLLLPPRAIASLEIAHLFSTLANIALGLVLVALATRLTPLVQRRESHYIAALLGAVGTAAMSMTSAGVLPSFCFFVSLFLCASAGLWMVIAWYEMLSTRGVRGFLLFLMVGTILGLLVSTLIAALPPYVAICATTLLPFAGMICLRPVVDEALVVYPEHTERPSLKELLAKVPLRLVIVSGIINLVIGVIRTLQLSETPSYDPMVYSVVSFLFEAAPFLVAGLIAFYAYRKNTIIAFYIAIPFIAFAALMMLLLDFNLYGIPYFAASIGARLVHILVLLMLIKTTLEKRVPLLLCAALLTAFEFAGTIIGQAATVLTAGNTMLLSVLLLCTLIIAVLVLLGQRLTLAVDTPPVQEAESRDEQVKQLCSTYALSPRESEILGIWIKGYSSAYIERTLFITKNTVKTHLSHIYAKTGTSSRENLLILLDTSNDQG